MDVSARSENDAYRNPLQVMMTLRKRYRDWVVASDRKLANPKPWPAGFDPKTNPVFAYNEITISAPRGEVFTALTDATSWPAYYPNCSRVKLLPGADGRTPTALEAGTRFSWATFGTSLTSEVSLYEKDDAIGWSAKSLGLTAFHRWILEPAPGGGTRLITEECQYGLTAKLSAPLLNPTMHGGHQLWLERLKARLERTS
jgi:uncharacterized protein YndB with AHSA1/START domain